MAQDDEVRTTIVLSTGLHVWLRQYAIARHVSFARLIYDILLEWAKSRGFQADASLTER
jgi:hypothetical protein